MGRQTEGAKRTVLKAAGAAGHLQRGPDMRHGAAAAGGLRPGR